jgi:hypothetical protein
MNNLYCEISNVTGIESVSVSTSHTSSMSTATFICREHTLNIGNIITIDLGYIDNHSIVFTGYVKNIEYNVPNNVYTITANDVITRAVEFFVAPSDPTEILKWHDIAAEDLVSEVMSLAGISVTTIGATTFTFAVSEDVYAEVNLVSSYDYSKNIADIIAWHIYADENGTVYFLDRKPYVMDGDHSIFTITDSNILKFTYKKSDRDLRNRIVVYGYNNLHSEASASSPYLPTGFYKTVVVSAADVIDTQDMADKACAYNLEKLNRLTEQISVSVIGDPTLLARKVITVNEAYSGINENWYIYTADHTWGKDGYTVDMELRK